MSGNPMVGSRIAEMFSVGSMYVQNRNLKYSDPGWDSAYSFLISPTAILTSNNKVTGNQTNHSHDFFSENDRETSGGRGKSVPAWIFKEI